MLGIQIFIGARGSYDLKGGLSEAAFWIGLRQEIYVATVRHRAMKINLEHCHVDRSFETTNDFGWANRAVVHCADVLNCCFAGSAVSLARWTALLDASEMWQEWKPSSFTPIYYMEADREKAAFPTIWHSHACHSTYIYVFEFVWFADNPSSYWSATPQAGSDLTFHL